MFHLPTSTPLRRTTHRATLLLASVLTIANAGAQTPQQAGDIAGGVVTSQPVTVGGNDFCQYFIAAWRDKEGSERYPLAIRERPSARWGSEVTIDYAQRRIYRIQLPASRAALRSLGAEAADAAYQAVQQAEAERQLLQDADLAPDEI